MHFTDIRGWKGLLGVGTYKWEVQIPSTFKVMNSWSVHQIMCSFKNYDFVIFHHFIRMISKKIELIS